MPMDIMAMPFANPLHGQQLVVSDDEPEHVPQPPHEVCAAEPELQAEPTIPEESLAPLAETEDAAPLAESEAVHAPLAETEAVHAPVTETEAAHAPPTETKPVDLAEATAAAGTDETAQLKGPEAVTADSARPADEEEFDVMNFQAPCQGTVFRVIL